MKLRRTKIVATLGPATDDDAVLTRMIEAGVDVARLNFSHGTHEKQAARIKQVHRIAAAVGREVGLVGDLGGSKIRVESFVGGKAVLQDGSQFILDTGGDKKAGSADSIAVSHPELTADLKPGDVLLLGDGHIILKVEKIDDHRVICQVEAGGVVSNHQGINRRGGGLSAGALTEKDRKDIAFAAKQKLDYVAVSFVRSAEDVETARRLLQHAGSDANIVAKIERVEAVDHIEEIVDVSDAIMVARGDLGVEMGYAELTGLQKRLIRLTRTRNRIVITATQMMESMIHNPVPTRAEVSDVANAVMDGSDALMLSAESAVGEHPVKAVQAMSEIIVGAEKHQLPQSPSRHRMNSYFERTDEAIAMAVMYTANHLNVRAIIALTESGATTQWMSRIRSDIPIFALTRHAATRRRVTLYRGVHPVPFDILKVKPTDVFSKVSEELIHRGIVDDGDLVVFTRGDLSGISGATNTMKIMRVGNN